MALREALMIRYRAIIMENVAIFGSIIERSSNIDGNIIDRLDSCLGKISEAQDKMNTLDKVKCTHCCRFSNRGFGNSNPC